MSVIALVGGLFATLPERILARLIKPLVAFAAGSLTGGAFFHMLPHALQAADAIASTLTWVVIGFAIMLALDQLLEWNHCHKVPSEQHSPLGPLLLIADGLHNLLGGLAIGAVFMADIRAGIAAWIAAALHEIPQEMGDFGAIVHSGYSRSRALLLNFICGLAFPVGGLIAYFVGVSVDLTPVVALGAGNFIYIAAADLIPEVKRAEKLGETAERFIAFALGAGLLYAVQGVGAGH